MTLAKTLGGGFPVGAMIARKDIAELMGPGTHASTFGGSPLACVACLGVLDAIEKENLLENVNKAGAYLRKKLYSLKEKYPGIVRRIKGLGVMLAIELDRDGAELVNACLQKRLLINCTHGNVLRIMPSIAVTGEEIDEATKILDECLAGIK